VPRDARERFGLRQKSWSRRTYVITFRLPKDIFELIEMIAAEKNLSPHEWCRRVVLAYLKAKGYVP